MFRRLGRVFSKKLQKRPPFAKKHEKSSIWPKLATFSRKPPCFGFLVNFSAKSSKNCPISRISMKNRQFGQNVQLFRANHHVSTFGSTFKQKVVNSAPFCEKACKIVDLAKTCNFFEQTTTFCRLGELFSKKLQKVSHFARKHEKTSIWQKSAIFSSKPRCLGVWVNFEAKSCKKCVIWRKAWEIVDLAKMFNFLEQTTKFRRFDQLFSKKLLKKPQFSKKHEKSSISLQLATFSSKPPCFDVWNIFSAKSWKKCSILRKTMRNRRFGQNVKPSRANHHVSAFGWTFKKKSCKKCLISRKSMKNRRFGQNLQLFRANHHVSAFGSTFQRKSAKRAPFRKKAWEIVDLAKLWNFFEQTTMSRRLGHLFRKKLPKAPDFARKHEKSSIWPKCSTLWTKLPCFNVSVNFSA